MKITFLGKISVLVASLVGCANASDKRPNKELLETIYFIPIDANYLEHLNYNDLDPETLTIEEYYKQYNNYGISFFTNQSKEKVNFDIFSSFVRFETFRRVSLYNNPSEIQEYFLKKYNKSFFPKDYKEHKWEFSQTQLFSQSKQITFEDFKKIIQPNFKFDFLTTIELDELQQKENELSVVFNWDFFNDKAYMHIENSLFRDNYLAKQYKDVSLKNNFQAINYAMEFLFEYPFSTVDTRLNGLALNESSLKDKTISKYFIYSKNKKGLIPVQRGFKNFYNEKIKSEEQLKSDFQFITEFFNENTPFAQILEE